MTTKPKWILAFSCALVVLGLLFSVQFKAQNSAERELYQQRQENLIVMVKNLTEKRQKLSLEMSELSAQLYDRRNSLEDESMVLQSLQLELSRLEYINGSCEVTGQGIEVSFPATSFVQYTDIISLVNELWAAGAEAISVSGVRLNTNSYIFYMDTASGTEICVNNIPVTWPLRIQAIGDANNLEKGLTLPGGFMDLMMYNKIYPTLRRKESIQLTAVKSPTLYYYMKEYTPPPAEDSGVPSAGAGGIAGSTASRSKGNGSGGGNTGDSSTDGIDGTINDSGSGGTTTGRDINGTINGGSSRGIINESGSGGGSSAPAQEAAGPETVS